MNCIICGAEYTTGYALTCSKTCHENLVHMFTDSFGEHIKVVDAETGIEYKVPRQTILEKGLKHDELSSFPRWSE